MNTLARALVAILFGLGSTAVAADVSAGPAGDQTDGAGFSANVPGTMGGTYHEHGEEQAVLFSEASFGGWGGPEFKVSTLTNEPVLLIGGRGGVLINEVLTIGGAGWGVVNKPNADFEVAGRTPKVSLGYGGVFIGATLFPNQIVHPTLGATFGGGGASYQFESPEASDIDSGLFALDAFVGAELNVTEFARLELGLDYRSIFGSDLPQLQNSDLSGFAGHLIVKFGFF